MSEWIHIFCRSIRTVTRREITNFIKDGVYFDESLRFEPPADSPELDNELWESLDVFHHVDKRPITFERDVASPFMKTVIREILDESGESELPEDLVQKLTMTHQRIVINYKYESVTDEGWQMLDALMTHLARGLEGLIFVHGEGFYDENRDLIFKT